VEADTAVLALLVNGAFEPDNVSLWIVSYRRIELLKETIRQWQASYPFTDGHIIANDPAVDYAEIEARFGGVFKIHYNLRPSWMAGSIAQCWNIAMLHTFDQRDWCLMSQDDVTVNPGWDKLITNDYWTYIAPIGDVIQLQSLDGFNSVGWYDERFRAIGGPEADMVLRIMQAYPEQASIHDHHPWHLYNNDVGLQPYWESTYKQPGSEHEDTWKMHRWGLADEECFGRWNQKWGKDVNELLINCVQTGDWSLAERRPGWEEIDWYPHFTRRLVELHRY
jgi:hypothetical protein